MNPQQPMRLAGRMSAVALCCWLAMAFPRASQAPVTAGHDLETAAQLRLRALDLAYNLDHDQALALLARAVALDPDDAATHRTLAGVLWLNMLFRRGAVTVDHYLGSFSQASVQLSKPDPDLDRQFRMHLERAITLAEQRVAAAPRDAQAHYDLGAAVGLQASYLATVEGRMLAGFRAARRCFDEHERVLALDGSRKDAGLIVGTYRYVVSTLSMSMRVVAYVAGFGGGRSRGIQVLEAAAAHGSDARTEAMFALVLVYNRERRYDDALRMIQVLRRAYPRNRLVVLEAGATSLRAGRAQQAENFLTEGLAMLEREIRPRIPGEEALWRYKRGTARALLGRTELALDDLRNAASADAPLWVKGRARVELGRLALKSSDRATAIDHARRADILCREGHDSVCIEEARTLLRHANGR
jgi:tetratricopeptide (TPR) repeat protein